MISICITHDDKNWNHVNHISSNFIGSGHFNMNPVRISLQLIGIICPTRIQLHSCTAPFTIQIQTTHNPTQQCPPKETALRVVRPRSPTLTTQLNASSSQRHLQHCVVTSTWTIRIHLMASGPLVSTPSVLSIWSASSPFSNIGAYMQVKLNASSGNISSSSQKKYFVPKFIM